MGLGRMPFRFLNTSIGVDVWRKDLVGGDVAVAIVYMGNASYTSVAEDEVQWVKTKQIYSDKASRNLGIVSGCSHGDLVACCKAACLADSTNCTALNMNEQKKRC